MTGKGEDNRMKRRHKYRAQPQVTEDGRFDSKKELARWNQLKLLQSCGVITDLTRERSECTFPLRGQDGLVVCRYIADFLYTENGKRVVEDAKGFKTDAYNIKRKLFVGEYGSKFEHRES